MTSRLYARYWLECSPTCLFCCTRTRSPFGHASAERPAQKTPASSALWQMSKQTSKLPTALEAKATLQDVPKTSLSHLRPMNRFGAALALLIVSAVPGSRSRRHAVLRAHVKDRAKWQGNQSRPVLSKERVKTGDIGGIERTVLSATTTSPFSVCRTCGPPNGKPVYERDSFHRRLEG
ncbi:hypothetical protein N658DRAFT_340517 [Parathielavia hyrcaniae]|uniref:Uncharacterized protein n=1 Tax=Parathielavia hyrcaniae TaxID=113614 RepID=A0AAN6Q7S1_9PEZI|nr:hypothetical protein N658DRAFT_340517 [Parathielavia hyrcaniae]